ncbi:DUF4365 domain-containing protein [Herbaspirillum seropedicae]|uniref:DUF4365 domain-containing protein n=1 Tax=Herbaspirillum seropedicae (strain SmR1) TaxID=757424 RepID=D8IVT6_HERSS|nr:DUF4365 domain-containing protein [Herbaspirillum seropedicae]ADJ65894.1 conserved hypothetical protein [Herbaspirillum seropedicae SmR1]AKN67682.1 hypothetical protein ACP92_22110 [Herbaspirillum seropedicae]NQE29725.1 hypothetical protein [Herbaspirillum seropedicae]UMU23706.1 DUF4365 domain-containing protein [Herbaspirillum seropedicae]
MARYDPKEQIGVNAVQKIVLKELGWIFREQPLVDMGIDAHIELVQDEPTGKLVALQIKTGPSHFVEREDAYVFRGSLTHLEYWINHSLPVILVAHFDEENETYWVLVDEGKVRRAGKSWTIAIPKENKLGKKTRAALAKVFAGSPAQNRMRRLAIDASLMRHVKAGMKVSVELEDWVNKGLRRGNVTVYVYDKYGRETLSKEWFQYYMHRPMKELVETLFPWSVASIDVDFYDENCEDNQDIYSVVSRMADHDNGFEYESAGEKEIYPYKNDSGEVDCYRLQLRLNQLGRAFLLVSDYLEGAE